MLWTDLTEIKGLMQIDPDDHSEDFTLNLYIQWATDILQEVLDRDISYKTRTLVYPGTGNQKLLARHRPIYPTQAPDKASTLPFTALEVKVLQGANWGEAPSGFTGVDPLTYGVDYALRVDLDDGGSREAILYRLNNYWPRPFMRQAGLLSSFVGPDMGSVQVTSTAGYTIDMLPSTLHMAADWLITKLAYLFPLGTQLSSESYIDRSIGLNENQRRWLIGSLRPMILFHKNWTF